VADTEEGRLLAQAQRGDQLAFASLVQLHQQRVFAHCYRLLNNSVEAEDLCSETFLRAYQHLRELRADPSIIHWLLRVAQNLAISQLRKRVMRPMIDLEDIGEYPSDQPLPEDQVVEHGRQEVVKACLSHLSLKERTAVLMFYLEERPLEEIARVLGCGVAGAKSRVHRARHRLKALVMAALGEEIPQPMVEKGQIP